MALLNYELPLLVVNMLGVAGQRLSAQSKKSDDIVTTFTPEKKEKIIVTKEVTI